MAAIGTLQVTTMPSVPKIRISSVHASIYDGKLKAKTPQAQTSRSTCRRVSLTRSNSTSTIQVTDTMSHPNRSAIMCEIAYVLHERLEQGEMQRRQCEQKDAVELCSPFDDQCAYNWTVPASNDPDDESSFQLPTQVYGLQEDRGISRSSRRRNSDGVPSLAQVAEFLASIYNAAQCSEECTLVCLVYIERLLIMGPMTLTVSNWRPIVVVAMLLASKVWDDLSMVNEDFSIFMEYPLSTINTWEIHFLNMINFNVRVSASQYAMLYFDLRNAYHKRSGGSNVAYGEMDVDSASRLEVLTSTMETRLQEMRGGSTPRTDRSLRRSVSYLEPEAPDMLTDEFDGKIDDEGLSIDEIAAAAAGVSLSSTPRSARRGSTQESPSSSPKRRGSLTRYVIS